MCAHFRLSSEVAERRVKIFSSSRWHPSLSVIFATVASIAITSYSCNYLHSMQHVALLYRLLFLPNVLLNYEERRRGDLCSRSKSPMPFKRDLALQNIPFSKQPFKMQPRLENKTSLEVSNIICPLVHTKIDQSMLVAI